MSSMKFQDTIKRSLAAFTLSSKDFSMSRHMRSYLRFLLHDHSLFCDILNSCFANDRSRSRSMVATLTTSVKSSVALLTVRILMRILRFISCNPFDKLRYHSCSMIFLFCQDVLFGLYEGYPILWLFYLLNDHDMRISLKTVETFNLHLLFPIYFVLLDQCICICCLSFVAYKTDAVCCRILCNDTIYTIACSATLFDIRYIEFIQVYIEIIQG